MLTYAINPNYKEPGTVEIEETLLKLVSKNTIRYQENSSLKLDKEYMLNKYGFDLSKYECDQFNTHHEIWKTFKNSNEPFCLIMSENANLKYPHAIQIEVLNEHLRNNQDWDIYFPFEKSEVEDDDKYEFGYLLGCYWGMDAYFISRKGVDKLLLMNTIRQPLDEEILTKSILGELEVYCEEINCFDFYENKEQKKGRQLAIGDAVFNSNAWSSENKQKIQVLMSTISSLATENKINITLCDGSLLGQVRHGSIMPWDDDVDLALNKENYKYFITLLESNTKLAHGIFHWGQHQTPYCKIWDENGQSIPGYAHKFPFVDIWFYNETDSQIVFDAGTIYTKDIFYPFSDVTFEGSVFKLPAKPQKCLDISYSDWKTKIKVFPWSHQHEQNSFMPLSYSILVDHTGRITNKPS